MAAFLAGCSTSRIEILSDQEVEILRVNEGGAQSIIGKAPLTVDYDSVFTSGKDFAQLIARKGSQQQSIVLTKTLLPLNARLLVNFPEVKEPAAKESSESVSEAPVTCPPPEKYAQIARGIAEVQSLMTKRDYGMAQTRLTVMSSEYPSVSVIYDLLGNSLYLQKNLKEALAAYERSLEIDPANMETKRIAEKLRAMLYVPSQEKGN